MMSVLRTTALLGTLAASVSAHGHVQGVVVAGTYYTGYDPSFQYQSPPPTVIGWSDPEDQSNGYIAPSAYSDADIICHLSATPGGTSATITAGDVVELQWTDWPDSHHGPVLTYLAPVTGAFADVDKTTLEFFKIDEAGLIDDTSVPGTWASDQLIANNQSWAVTIPTGIAPGKYVLRHEIIALHSAGQADGAQNYPQCINIEVTGSGTDSPAGTLGTALYKEDAPGVLINIYTSLSSYTIPGPTLYSGAVTMSQTAVANGTSAASTTVAAASTSAVAASATATSAAVNSTSFAAVHRSVTLIHSTGASPSIAGAIASNPVSTFAAEQNVATSSCTETIVATATDITTATVTGAAESSAAPYSAIASAVSDLPPAALTSTIPTTLPSATTSAGTGESWSGVPSKPLPAGYTLKDLMEWVAYSLKKSGKENVHQRDFRI